MASTFHRFGELPTELRLMVWENALRALDRRPGAHFFTVFDKEQDGDDLIKYAFKDENSQRYMLAAPNCALAEAGSSWMTDNPSAYLVDAGLWTACRESQQVMEKHYKTAYWKERLSAKTTKPNRDGQDIADACVTGIFSHENKARRFAIHPHQDLICWRAFNPATIEWNPRTGEFMNDSLFSLIEDFSMANSRAGVHGFVNIAIEYDPSWIDQLGLWLELSDELVDENSPMGFLLRALNSMCFFSHPCTPVRIWLIDYTLKLKGVPKATRIKDGEEKQPVTFYGYDKAFVEVDKAAIGDYSCDERSSVFEFRNNIYQEWGWEYVQSNHSASSPWCGACKNGACTEHFRAKRTIGILACVEQ